MNCGNWEERIALYAGGDLAAAEAAEVERHLADCPGCQVFASGLRESLGLLAEAHREPLREADLAAVRARVLLHLARAERPWWRRAWIYGLAAAAAAAWFLIPAPRVAAPPARPPANRAALHTAPAAVAEEPPVVPARTRRSARRRVARHVTRPQFAPAVTTVKLLTDDPNVVIYWITDKSGE